MMYPQRLFALLVIAVVLASCGDEEPTEGDDFVFTPSSDGDEDDDTYEPFIAGKTDGVEFSNAPLEFSGACADGERLTIAAVGDVLLHGRLQRQAYGRSSGFTSLWSGISDLMQEADVTYANLEGPTAPGVNKQGRSVSDPGERFDDVVYSSYPMFNYHPRLLDDLQDSGVDVVSTANNHSLDRWSLGATRTIDELDKRDLPYTGTRRAGTNDPWHTFTNEGGFRLAWIACTYGTNGIPDREDQVLWCYSDTDEIVGLIKDLSSDPAVDAVIVTPHWGEEYKATPNQKQVDLAHQFLDAGALAIIGSHPHVLQPWERYITDDGRETFAIYSLGNFVSGQRHLPRRSTLLLYLGLTRTSEGVVINGARYVPLHVDSRDGLILNEAIDRVGGFADSRALTVEMFGDWNVHKPGDPLVTDPQCDPSWEPPKAPHPHTGWIGGGCDSELACGGTTCLEGPPGGLCTELCERTCPDRSGRATTFCVDLGYDNSGVCVAQCASDGDCRDGYSCQQTARYNEPQTVRSVCVPDVTP